METRNPLACNLVGDAVRTFGRVRLRVSGTSMVPAILPGDMVTVERAGADEVSIGDVVVFVRDGRLVAHRAITTSDTCGEPRLVTRGDRMRKNDSAVSSSELLGKITSVERAGRQVRLRTRLGAAQQMICGLLRISNRATSLYLRASSL